jgi:hypothetical protein
LVLLLNHRASPLVGAVLPDQFKFVFQLVFAPAPDHVIVAALAAAGWTNMPQASTAAVSRPNTEGIRRREMDIFVTRLQQEGLNTTNSKLDTRWLDG